MSAILRRKIFSNVKKLLCYEIVILMLTILFFINY